MAGPRVGRAQITKDGTGEIGVEKDSEEPRRGDNFWGNRVGI